MLRNCIRFLLLSLGLFYKIKSCNGQFSFKNIYEPTPTPLPFPPCRADDVPCLRRGLRTFFFLMDTGHMGMQPIDPAQINSVVVSRPEVTVLLRKINVTGARWTKLGQRRLQLTSGKSGVIFLSDLHVTGELTMSMAESSDPLVAYLTMDMQNVESNITYTWMGQRSYTNDDYIIIGPERVAVRNTRLPTFFLQPGNEDARKIEQVLQAKQSILDHMSNEVVVALMHAVVDNFRLFASRVPVKNYYII
ncbi:uncharacterized protein [Battus philenor]|uniref:uncharacterized protein n=1 Tax=Battus philenor TaxID=42288 RepID=UPI0035CF586E